MSHIVWLILKFYLLLFGSDTVYIFFKKMRYLATLIPSHADRGPNQLLKSKILKTDLPTLNFDFNYYYG